MCYAHAGASGPMGERGRRGGRGEPGVKGDAGDVGPAGLKGEKGEPSLVSSARRSVGARVAFSVARSQKLGPVSEDTPVGFDVVFTNIGDGFDTTESRFVCRTNGTYVFSAHLLGQNNMDVYAWIMINDKHKVGYVPLDGLEWANEYAARAYTTPDSAVTYKLYILKPRLQIA